MVGAQMTLKKYWWALALEESPGRSLIRRGYSAPPSLSLPEIPRGTVAFCLPFIQEQRDRVGLVPAATAGKQLVHEDEARQSLCLLQAHAQEELRDLCSAASGRFMLIPACILFA